MMKEPLKPYIDFVFKRIFGSEENKDEVLLNFLNEGVRETEPKPFTSLTLLNPYIDKDMIDDKQSILDIRAKNQDGKQVNLEIQVANQLNMLPRTLYYWAKLYEGQLNEGDDYVDLKKSININIINFNLFANDRFHNTFHLTEDHTGEMMMDHIEIHFMELPKLDQRRYSMDDRLVRWLTFIKGAPKEMWEELAMNTPGLKKAMTTLEFLSQSKEVRALALAREKAELDQKSALRWARTEGEEKGRVKGEYEKAIQVAKNLLIEGDTDISKIARITGLSKSGIEKLKEQKH
jgi:predicted transposase/invertase (TIGR01784 family)